MSRIVSVWLKDWPIARFLLAQGKEASGSRAEAVSPRRPLVLVAPGKGGARLVALNEAARCSGLAAGELLSSARSKALDLQSRDADPAAEAAALRKLALWCQRYTPLVIPWDEKDGADGLFLDTAGCAHLFGGEAGLLADLAGRLRGFGLDPRLALAGTPGAAWAMARYGGQDRAIVPAEGTEAAIRNLPLAALRLPDEVLVLLRRLGFRRVKDLLHQPRAPLRARFGTELLLRLDQALGREPEPLAPVDPPPCYHAHVTFAEPILTEEHVVVATRRLLDDLAATLASDGAGARMLRLLLFRVDGEVAALDVGLAAPSRDVEHIAQLFALRLDRLCASLETDFGFDAAAIHVTVAEPLSERQAVLYADSGQQEGLARLIDRLEQRLGKGAVHRLAPYQSHIPERSVRSRPAVGGPAPDWAAAEPVSARPLLLLSHPEEADVVALVPEGPPRQFRWRRVLHQVAHAEGPERIAPEWWRLTKSGLERDYYVVEDEEGRRFWLCRAGRYGRGNAAPRWFVHGVFA